MNLGGITTIYGVCAVALVFYFVKATTHGHRIVQSIVTVVLVMAVILPNIWPLVFKESSQAAGGTSKAVEATPASQPQTRSGITEDKPPSKSSQMPPAAQKPAKNKKAGSLGTDHGSTRASSDSPTNREMDPQHSSAQSCPNGICIGGNNYGSPTVINQGLPSLSITSAQADEITRAMTSYAQRSVEIQTSGITDETVSAGLQMKSALEKAGLVVNFQKIMMLFVPGGTKPPPGISFGATSDQDDLANGLGLALVQSHVIDHPVRLYRLPGMGEFHIYVGASTP